MRVVYSSLMAALVVVALFWGNCLSCPQVLFSAAQQDDPHGCCHEQKPAPSQSKDCQSQGLQSFLKADPGAHVQALPAAALPAAVQAAALIPPVPTTEPVEVYPPPDLLALHSAFRI